MKFAISSPATQQRSQPSMQFTYWTMHKWNTFRRESRRNLLKLNDCLRWNETGCCSWQSFCVIISTVFFNKKACLQSIAWGHISDSALGSFTCFVYAYGWLRPAGVSEQSWKISIFASRTKTKWYSITGMRSFANTRRGYCGSDQRICERNKTNDRQTYDRWQVAGCVHFTTAAWQEDVRWRSVMGKKVSFLFSWIISTGLLHAFLPLYS